MAPRRIAVPAQDLSVDRAEFARRMGMPEPAIDPELEEDVRRLLLPMLAPAAVWDEADVVRLSEDTLDCGFGPVTSRSLSRYLRGCGRVLLLACTIGPGPDLLMPRLASSPARRFAADALGSAAAESLAEEVSRRLAKEYDCLPRFSPGYGDLPLSVQPAFLDRLNAGRLLGIRLTAGFLMIPSKSVTAVVGIRRSEAGKPE